MWLVCSLTFVSSLAHLGYNELFTLENQAILKCQLFSEGEIVPDSDRCMVLGLWLTFSYGCLQISHRHIQFHSLADGGLH